LSLPIADIEALGATYGDADLTPPRDTVMTYPALASMERLQRLHAAAGHLVEHAPLIIASPQAAYGLEQALVGALADCLGAADRSVQGCRSYSRIKIMRRLYAILEVNTDQVFHVPEICKMLGVSNRMLTTCCQEALGMSPRRYFRVRQLNLAHRALKWASPQTTSVTEIATAHGFWELGRFSAAHQALFGELPSATLRRARTPRWLPEDINAFLCCSR
jgi:AraC-like DNA-binding protein